MEVDGAEFSVWSFKAPEMQHQVLRCWESLSSWFSEPLVHTYIHT